MRRLGGDRPFFKKLRIPNGEFPEHEVIPFRAYRSGSPPKPKLPSYMCSDVVPYCRKSYTRVEP
jgi:hypothetical protein